MPDKKRHPNANTVLIDGDKFRHLCWRHRLPLASVGPLIGRCDAWASVIAYKGHMGFWAADDLATELGLHVEQLIAEIGSSVELERVNVT